MLNKKELFPFFQYNPEVIYFDSAATTHKPDFFFEYINTAYTKFNFPAGKSYYSFAEESFEILNNTKELIAKFIHSNKENIFFTPSSTLSSIFLNNLFTKILENIKEKVKILLPVDVHNSFIYEWIKDEHKNYIDIYWYDENNFKQQILSNDFFCILITLKSNITGNEFDLNLLKHFDINKNKPFILVDASQYFAINKLNLTLNFNIDALFFSSHKMYGPYGISPLYLSEYLLNFIKKNNLLNDEEIQNSIKFYLNKYGSIGVPNFYIFNQILEWINKEIWKNENCKIQYKNYFNQIVNFLNSKQNIVVISNDNYNIISFYIKNKNSHNIAEILGLNNILVRSGRICNEKFFEYYKYPNIIRISLGIYNTQSDIDMLINNLTKII